MNTTPQRENWNGHPVELGDVWTLLTKVARCLLASPYCPKTGSTVA
jgi:hypothetical protein